MKPAKVYAAERYVYLKKLHRCVKCQTMDERTLAGSIYCQRCGEKDNARKKQQKKVEVEE